MQARELADRMQLDRQRLGRMARLAMHPSRIPDRLRKRPRKTQRELLLARLPKHACCAEVGSWRGEFASAILASTLPQRLHLIDPWEYRSEQKYARATYGGLRQGQEEMDAIYAGVLARFKAEIDSGQVLVQRARSLEAAASFPDASLDWVYIDADHTYEGVRGDLEAYYRVLKPGGILAGDDYGHLGGWFGDGVTRAVDEFAVRCAGLTILGTQFLLKKP